MNTTTIDPFADIVDAARRQAAEETANRQLREARSRMIIGKTPSSVFFATLALRLDPKIAWDVPTAATDGRSLFINPDWFGSLTDAERLAIVAHEVMHPAQQHHTRRGVRDPRRWNIAADATINPLLRDAGYNLPAGGIFPGIGDFADLPPNLSAEEYYTLIDDDGDASPDPGGFGGVLDAATDEAGKTESAAEWQAAVASAANIARQRGDLPASLNRLVTEILEPVVDWQNVLREFVRSHARNDYTWSRPNRRYVHQGLYLPSLHSEQIGRIVIAIDTSGSIDADTINRFAAECEGILQSYDCTVDVLCCDAAIQSHHEWQATDGPLIIDFVGGGGTDHRPVWDWIAEQPDPIECVICLTDGFTQFGDDPGIPVLWCLTEPTTTPFGKTIEL